MAFGGNFARLVDTRPPGVVLSPSQIEKWYRCHRMWAFEYIGGVRPPPKPSAQLGTDVHTILENWLKRGTPPDIRSKAGKIAAKMIQHLPLPGTGVCERQFYLTTRNGFSYTGKIDWSGIFWDWPTVVDHKTTGDLKYAKTEAGLHCDTQGLTYTIAGCHGFEVDEVQLLWNYGTTKDREPVVVPVRTRIHLKIAEEKFESVIENVAAEIVAARQSRADPHSFPPNPLACDDFGGCPHRHICRLTDNERIQILMDPNQQPTLVARLNTLPIPGNVYPQQPMASGPTPGFIPPTSAFSPPGAQPQFVGLFTQPQMPQQGYGVQPALGAPAQVFSPQVPQQQQQVVPGNVQFAPAQPPQQQPQQPAQSFSFAPPQMPQQQPQVAFHPDMGPNPPENGTQMQQAAPQNGETPKGKRGRGRPKKGEEAQGNNGVSASIDGDKDVFLFGVRAMIANPNWNGSPDQLLHAGNVAVQAFHAKFG